MVLHRHHAKKTVLKRQIMRADVESRCTLREFFNVIRVCERSFFKKRRFIVLKNCIDIYLRTAFMRAHFNIILFSTFILFIIKVK